MIVDDRDVNEALVADRHVRTRTTDAERTNERHRDAAGDGYVCDLTPVAGCDLFESRFISACEAALKDTLRAPSAYRRIDVTETSENISIDEFLAGEDDAVGDFYRRSYDHAVRLMAIFEFDAANAHGTPLRLFAKCTYDTVDGDDKYAGDYTVRIDGKTKSDRIREAIDRLR